MKGRLSPSQILVLGFVSVILIGAALLMLPVATTKGITLTDAVFTSTSAVCVTGLIVKDTPKDFTPFGQVIIMLLIQIGGLGYMTSATIIFLIIGKRIGLGERLIMREQMSVAGLEGIVRFAKAVLKVTLLFELTGAAILCLRFMQDMNFEQAAFFGLFHAVSAFNNAGFSLFSDNLIRYRGDIIVNLTITTLIIFGGIGFIVISEVYKYYRRDAQRISQHTKIVLSTTAILIAAGACLIFIFETSNPGTFDKMTLNERVLSSYFAAVTARTAGFNTIDYSAMRIETLFLTIMLMFVGASPGSTGGGIKTSTFAIVIMRLCATMRGMRDTVIFKRRVSMDVVSKSFLLVTLAALLIMVATLYIIRTEDAIYLSTMFEVTSAFGTVGLSVGDGGVRSLSALFTSQGKLIISLIMLLGRLGPLTFGVAVIRHKEERYRFPEGRVIIG
jgi:trk system potassium uptake protein TrkH